jgi:hypothetical protein
VCKIKGNRAGVGKRFFGSKVLNPGRKNLARKNSVCNFIKTSFVSAIYHLKVNKESASLVIDDLLKKNEVELISYDECEVPEWQKAEVRSRIEYYSQHPEKMIDWEDVQKMIVVPNA